MTITKLVSFLPVQIGPAENFSKLTVFSSGSRGYRATFKAVLDLSNDSEEKLLKECQVSVLVTEIGSKGQEDPEAFKAAGSVEAYAARRENGTGDGPIADGGTPRIAE
jgi:hypothetical protein